MPRKARTHQPDRLIEQLRRDAQFAADVHELNCAFAAIEGRAEPEIEFKIRPTPKTKSKGTRP